MPGSRGPALGAGRLGRVRTLRSLFTLPLLLALFGCPTGEDDFNRFEDDDDSVLTDDDDSAAVDDDDATPADDDDATPPPCDDDLLEPNDSQSNPTALEGDPGELVSCPLDEDWFVVDVAVGGGVSIDATYDVNEGQIELALFDAGSQLLDSQAGTGGGASVAWDGLTDGTALRVQLLDDLGDAPGTGYALTVQVTDPPLVCEPDAWEPNDALSTASAIPAGVLDGLTACPEDQDWWLVDLAVGEVIEFFVTFSHAEGDIDLALVDVGGTEVAMAATVTDDELLSHEALGTGAYALLVDLAADSGDVPGNAYGLDLAITPAPGVCATDLLEPNDTQGSAVDLPPGSWPDLAACPTDEDWYAIDVLLDQTLDVVAAFDLAEGLLELTLYDSGAQLLTGSTATLDGAGLTWLALADDQLALQVGLVTDPGDPGCGYSLDVSLTP